jgi:hypothetical protein
VFDDLHSWGVLDRHFIEGPFTRELVEVIDFWKEDHRGKCNFHHILSRVHATNLTYDCWYCLWPPDWQCLSGISIVKFHFFPFSILSAVEGGYYVQPTLEEKVSTFLPYGRLVSFPPTIKLLSHLYHWIRDLCFILWIIVQFYLCILFTFLHL